MVGCNRKRRVCSSRQAVFADIKIAPKAGFNSYFGGFSCFGLFSYVVGEEGSFLLTKRSMRAMMLSMKMSQCHPNKRHTAHGLCSTCYYKDRYIKFPELLKRRNATPAAVARKRRWHEKQIAAQPDYVISSHRQSRYGITNEQFNKMLTQQSHKCKICLKPFPATPKTIHIDHDHKTGKVRALLCMTCNAGLGMARDNEFNLARMIAYLRWSGSISQPDFAAWSSTDFVDLRGPSSQPSSDEPPSSSEQS